MGKDKAGISTTGRTAAKLEALGSLDDVEFAILQEGMIYRAEGALEGLNRMAREAERSGVIVQRSSEIAAQEAATVAAHTRYLKTLPFKQALEWLLNAAKEYKTPITNIVAAAYIGGLSPQDARAFAEHFVASADQEGKARLSESIKSYTDSYGNPIS